mgnify:CR=1 FL=1
MRFKNALWHSNSSAAGTGYGNQTALFVRRMKNAGYHMVESDFYGLEGSPRINEDGVLCLPRGVQPYGNDVIGSHMAYPHWKGELGDFCITLVDPWVMDSGAMALFPWAAWVPVDSTPVFEGNARSLSAARWVWAMSQHGMKELQNAGLDPLYVPHGIDSKLFYPQADRRAARENIMKYLKQYDLQDKFLIVTVAANKGSPSRKNFVEMIEAFALFVHGNEQLGYAPHPDALYYIHTEPRGVFQGEDIRQIAAAFGVLDKVILPGQYHILMGLFTEKYLNDLYNAADVFMLTSSEGFGIPTVEAQMAGCPVILADFAASSELCFSGEKVLVSKQFIPASAVFWAKPIVPLLTQAIARAYDQRGNEQRRKDARAGALAYDADTVFEKYMLPALAKIETDLTRERDAKNIIEIPARKRIAPQVVPVASDNPDVSVLIPVYNIETYGVDRVRRAVDSALGQQGVSVEVILSNDASTDETAHIICNWAEKDKRIKVINRAANGGPMAACNDAAAKAKGRYFIEGSCRAWFATGAFAAMVTTLDTKPDIGFCYGATQYHGASNHTHIPPAFKASDFFNTFPSLQAFMYRRAAWDRGCRYMAACQIDGKWVYPGDWDFALQMIINLGWTGYALPITTYNYYLSASGQQTHIFEAHKDEVMAEFNKRWKAVAV